MNEARLTRARDLLTERELDALVISNGHSRRYLTGYIGEDHPPDESAGITVIGPSSTRLIVSKNNMEWAAEEAPSFTVTGWTLPWAGDVISALDEIGAKRVGFEEEAISVANFRLLTEATGDRIAWLPLEGTVSKLRVIKDDREIDILCRASRITDAALLEGLAELDEGMTEIELAARFHDAMRRLGSPGPGFNIIVASGPNAARPHHAPGDRRIMPGEPVVIDMGATVEGYTADLTRTICLGEPTPEIASVYTIVLDAQRAVLASLRAGLTGKEVDQLARDVIAAAGHGDHFIHGLGHGVGMQIHEGPSAGLRSSDVMQTGMSLTIEPGIYIPGWGGVRTEDMVIIEDNGCRNLTTAPKVVAVRDMLAGVRS
jgi:Xaa-Pro aminopeptidase